LANLQYGFPLESIGRLGKCGEAEGGIGVVRRSDEGWGAHLLVELFETLLVIDAVGEFFFTYN
jgi:hypothetical protein